MPSLQDSATGQGSTMIHRLRNSWLYRSSSLYRLLAVWFPPPAVAKPLSSLRYVTMGGAGHLEMMVASLRSLAASWPALPSVRVVVADETALELVKRRLRWWKGALEVISWRMAAEWAASNVSPDLARFAEREPMGRKMAAVFQAAAEGPALYSDVDVLWFRYPKTVDSFAEAPAPLLAMSADLYAAYDQRLTEKEVSELRSSPFYCAGVMFAKGRIFESSRLHALLGFAAREGIGVTEQTLFAMLDRELGDRRLPPGEIFLSDADRFARSATFVGQPWAARHYVGQVRHLFWRDALALWRKQSAPRRPVRE